MLLLTSLDPARAVLDIICVHLRSSASKRNRPPLLVCLCLLLLLVTLSPAAASWTVLVYLDGDNNLEEMGILDLNEMELAPANAQVNVLVQFDRIPFYDSSNGNWTTTRRYRVLPDSDPSLIRSELLSDLGELNMGAPQTLIDFVTWGAANYPADHYLVILWDHGSGWRAAATPPPVKAICEDRTSYDVLTTAELVAAFAEVRATLGRSLDIIACDACVMGALEVAYPLAPFADYYLASEENVPGYGFPYDSLLTTLTSHPEMSSDLLCRTLVSLYLASYQAGSQGYDSVTLSASDLAEMPAVAAALSAFADELTASRGDSLHTWWDIARTTDASAIDLRLFADAARQGAPTDTLRAAAGDLLAALDRVLIANGSVGYPVDQHQGLSLYLPFAVPFDPAYLDLQLAADTTWDEFLQLFPTSADFAPDPFELDNTWTQAWPLVFGQDDGRRWFHTESDADWGVFTAEAGRTYALATERLGPLADTVLSLYASDGATLLREDDDGGWEPKASCLVFTAATSGPHYLRVRQGPLAALPPYFGGQTYYRLFVSPVSFPDVAPAHWAFRSVEACRRAEVVFGYWDGYHPAEPVNRAQMAVYVARALAGGDDAVPDGPTTPTFSDVPLAHWAYKYVEHLVLSGVVGGYGDGYYPDRLVDRGQMAVYLARALAGGEEFVPDDPDATPYFLDVPPDHWAYKYVEFVRAQGVVTGYWDGYRPDQTVTRDQMAVYLARGFGL